MRRTEAEWSEALPSNYGKVPQKPPLAFRGNVVYPEFILLRLIEDAGWRGVWVNSFRKPPEFWIDIEKDGEIPSVQQELYALIQSRTGNTRGGCWDIFAWRDDQTLVVESKQYVGDRVKPNQQLWLEGS